ncbi:hypothetical protein [Methylobacterium trifolii]|uniref:DUF1127 domain-containing protein n=1 Tax=Methylobacterium trifolii TaxID=1003092 RepID=A0ABQ4U1P7_9HYPH|nr:hypothetical protein [Methylobacterium trifolii]GJE61381.1 hypothetical protein MPOCJGCO_3503 [Methylobacterium trifolii]
MIPLVPTSAQSVASFDDQGPLLRLLRDILRSWIAHHQRMADLGISAADA